MKAILTGMNGTVAPALAKRLVLEGIEVVAWDRNKVSIDNRQQMEAFILGEKPSWVFHMAMGSPDWAAAIASICRENGIRFLFTGSVSAFDGSKPGPFPLDKEPDATDDYGRYKAECERKVLAANPDAIIARLGWQIGEAPGSNNMVDFLFKAAREKGKIEASRKWIPSCCHLDDTADALYRLMKSYPAGLYHIEGNPGIPFFDIVTRLKKRHNADWTIVETDANPVDIRLVNTKIPVGQLTARL